MEQFVCTRLPESHLLENYVLTKEYVDQLKVSIQEKLTVCGWAEVKVCYLPLRGDDSIQVYLGKKFLKELLLI